MRVVRFATNLHVGMLRDAGGQPPAKNRMIIDDKNAGGSRPLAIATQLRGIHGSNFHLSFQFEKSNIWMYSKLRGFFADFSFFAEFAIRKAKPTSHAAEGKGRP